MEFLFKEELLVGQPAQFVASRVAIAMLAFVGFETLFKYPMGIFADRYGPRKFVLGALGLCTLTPILMYFFRAAVVEFSFRFAHSTDWPPPRSGRR